MSCGSAFRLASGKQPGEQQNDEAALESWETVVFLDLSGKCVQLASCFCVNTSRLAASLAAWMNGQRLPENLLIK